MSNNTSYTASFTVGEKRIEALAKVWHFTPDENVDLWVSENGENAWQSNRIIYTLKDASTILRDKYNVKGIRIKWEQKI